MNEFTDASINLIHQVQNSTSSYEIIFHESKILIRIFFNSPTIQKLIYLAFSLQSSLPLIFLHIQRIQHSMYSQILPHLFRVHFLSFPNEVPVLSPFSPISPTKTIRTFWHAFVSHSFSTRVTIHYKPELQHTTHESEYIYSIFRIADTGNIVPIESCVYCAMNIYAVFFVLRVLPFVVNCFSFLQLYMRIPKSNI